MMRAFLSVVAAGLLLCCVMKPAISALIDYTIVFESANFSPFGAPVDHVNGTFALAFDNAADATGPVTINALNLNIAPLGFEYSAHRDRLVIGGLSWGVDTVAAGNDDLLLSIQRFSDESNRYVTIFAYSFVGELLYFDPLAQVRSVSPSPPYHPPTAVPIPAALPLFITALGGAAYLGWRRRMSAA